MFNLDLIILSIKINFILKKQKYKKDVFLIYNISYINIIFILLIKIITFYISTFIA